MLNFYQKWKKGFIYNRTKGLSYDVRLLIFQITKLFEIYVLFAALYFSTIFIYKWFKIVNNDIRKHSSEIAKSSIKKPNTVEEAMKYELLKLKKLTRPFTKKCLQLFGDAGIDINSQKAVAELMPTLRFAFYVSYNYTSYDSDSDIAYCQFDKAIKMLNKVKPDGLPDEIKKQLHLAKLSVSKYFEEQWHSYPPMNYIPKVEMEVYVAPLSGGKYRYMDSPVGEALQIEAGYPRIFLLPALNMNNVQSYIDEINKNNLRWIHLPIEISQQTFNTLINGINDLDELKLSIYQYFPSFCFPPNYDKMKYKIYDLSCLASLPNLKELYVGTCPKIKDFKVLRHMRKLQDLIIFDCPELKNLHSFSNLSNLEYLVIYNCPKINNLHPLDNLHKLKYLTLRHCHGINNLQPLSKLVNLQYLNLKEVYNSDNTSNLEEAKQMNDIFSAQVEKLKKKLPDCEIEYSVASFSASARTSDDLE